MRRLVPLAALLAAASPSAANERPAPDVEQQVEAPRRDAAQVTRDGTFLPTAWSARIGDQRVAAYSQGGYDLAPGEGGLFSTMVEGAIARRVAIRAGLEYVPSLETVAVSAGLRVGVLRQEQHRVDLALGALYKNRGFSEANGEVEVAVLLARRWNRVGTFFDLRYGQGIDAGERDAELRAAVLVAVHERVNVGFDARARLDLGQHDAAREANQLENDFDLIAGPLVTLAVSHLVLTAQAGAHTVVQHEVASAGFAAIGGVGTAF